jgi:hypothetical protein
MLISNGMLTMMDVNGTLADPADETNGSAVRQHVKATLLTKSLVT